MSINYSYSKIDTFQQCPFKFKLRYVDENFAYSDTVHTEIGTAIHKSEETIANFIMNNLPIDYISIKNTLILKMVELQYKYKDVFFIPDKSGRTFSDKIYEYLTSGIYKLEKFLKENSQLKICGIEQAFNITYENYTFTGFIDRVFYDTLNNKYIIQDIKTYPVKIIQDKLNVPLQFLIYALAVENLYNCTQEQIECQYYLPFCNLTQPAGKTNFINLGKVKLNNILEKIALQEFKPNPTPLCNYCEFCSTNPDAIDTYKFLCPYYSLWNRIDRKKSDIYKVANKWSGIENHESIMKNYLTSIKEVNING